MFFVEKGELTQGYRLSKTCFAGAQIVESALFYSRETSLKLATSSHHNLKSTSCTLPELFQNKLNTGRISISAAVKSQFNILRNGFKSLIQAI